MENDQREMINGECLPQVKPTHARPLTPALSPEWEGEGVDVCAQRIACACVAQAMNRLILLLSSLLLLATPLTARSAPASFQLASNGKTTARIVVGPNASARVKQAATTLGEYLHGISGAKF